MAVALNVVVHIDIPPVISSLLFSVEALALGIALLLDIERGLLESALDLEILLVVSFSLGNRSGALLSSSGFVDIGDESSGGHNGCLNSLFGFLEVAFVGFVVRFC